METGSASQTFPVFSAAVAVIAKRLTNAHKSGGLLESMNTFAKAGPRTLWLPPSQEPISDAACPCVRMMGMQAQTATGHPLVSRALRSGSSQANMDSSRLYLQTVQISVLSPIRNGLVRFDTSQPSDKSLGLYDWVARVMDAIETADSGTADSSLDRASCQPIEMTVLPVESGSEHYFEAQIAVSVWTKPFFRAQHSCPLGT